MLTRQKIALALLGRVGRPLSPTVFVKLMFLLRHESKLRADRTFYDFVPYKYGPFSFVLYWEVSSLRRDGYIAADTERLAAVAELAKPMAAELSDEVQESVKCIVRRYGELDQMSLVAEVYKRHPWFATRSELAETPGIQSQPAPVAKPAVYTVGYGGKSVDAFLNNLLRTGIQVVIDVRANPTSRAYGFSKRTLADIAAKLGIGYRHVPALGIPSTQRANLGSPESYHALLERYENKTLPLQAEAIREIACLMRQSRAALMCMEMDERRCHRSRLASCVARISGLEVVNL